MFCISFPFLSFPKTQTVVLIPDATPHVLHFSRSSCNLQLKDKRCHFFNVQQAEKISSSKVSITDLSDLKKGN